MPIAREGETEYASIHRNRSGIDAGCIDYGLRVQLVEDLSKAEQRELCSTADALRAAVYRACGRENAYLGGVGQKKP